MRSAAGVLLALGTALGVVAASVFGLGDRSVLVPPPEAVIEGFVRELATHRYSPALSYLRPELARSAGADSLRVLASRLESRAGSIRDVLGEPGRRDERRAEARAVVRAERVERLVLPFTLVFEEGAWSIASLDALAGREAQGSFAPSRTAVPGSKPEPRRRDDKPPG